VIIEPGTGKQKTFTLGTGPHGGGYDDLVFDGNSVFISASNPSTNTQPGIVRLRRDEGEVKLSGILNDNASANDVTTGNPLGPAAGGNESSECP
jgi:hypothetical protein